MALSVLEIPKKKEPITRAEFLKFLRSYKSGKRVNVSCIILPEFAEFVLDNHNNTNRNMNKTTVKQYVRNMENGLWLGDTGDTITFDTTGNLMNGQHRFEAVRQCGIPMEITLGFGYNTELKNAEGNGKVKSQFDMLTMKYGKNAEYLRQLATCIRFHYGYIRDQYQPHIKAGNENPSNLELALIENVIGESMMASIDFIENIGFPTKMLALSTAAYAHFLFKHTKYGEAAANKFMMALASGQNLSEGDPILVIRNRFLVVRMVALTNPKTKLKDQVVPWSSQKAKVLCIGLLQKGFNAKMAGKTWTSKEHNPESMIKLNGINEIFGIKIYQDIPSQGSLTL